jgi:hypothetical protein
MSALRSRQTSKKRERPSGKAVGPPAKGETIKATFYLSPRAIEALEALWMTRRQKAEPRRRGRIAKSLLVEEAINNQSGS